MKASRFGALGLRDFRLLWIGQTVSTAGDQIFPIAVTISVLNATGNSAGKVGLVLATRWVALVLFVLVGGVWADRLSRKAVMIGADAFRMVMVLGLALLPSSPPLWLLAVLVFLVGGGEAFFRPANGGLIPTVVPEDQRISANALTSVSLRTAAIIGPGIGALLVTTTSVQFAYLVDAATFGVSLLTLLRLHEPRVERPPSKSVLLDMRSGFVEVLRRRWASAVLAVAGLQLMAVVAPCVVLLPIIARRELGGDAVFGAALSIGAVGGLIGALVAMRMRPKHPGLVSCLSLLLWGMTPVVLLTPFATWWVFFGYFVAGLGIEPFIVHWTNALQREFPPHQLARVTSIDWLCSFALLPLGFVLVGPLVDVWGTATLLWIAVFFASVPTVALLLVPGMRDFHEPREDVPPPSDEPRYVPTAEPGTGVPRPADDVAEPSTAPR
jgi:DHA3 family tetracycline resistance protein-like MFS transporter